MSASLSPLVLPSGKLAKDGQSWKALTINLRWGLTYPAAGREEYGVDVHGTKTSHYLSVPQSIGERFMKTDSIFARKSMVGEASNRSLAEMNEPVIM